MWQSPTILHKHHTRSFNKTCQRTQICNDCSSSHQYNISLPVKLTEHVLTTKKSSLDKEICHSITTPNEMVYCHHD